MNGKEGANHLIYKGLAEGRGGLAELISLEKGESFSLW